MWGVKLIPIDEFDLAEIIVETSVSTAKTAGMFFEKRLPDGKGLRFQHDWKFKRFVD